VNEKEFYEAFKDEELSRRVFNVLKEESGKHSSKLILQNFTDFITHSTINKTAKLDESGKSSTIVQQKREVNESIESILEKLEGIKGYPLRTLYDNINIKEINQFGKISTDVIISVLKRAHSQVFKFLLIFKYTF
jgi:hypothetical protein